MLNFETVAKQSIAWTLPTFAEATAKSSLLKTKEEVEELLAIIDKADTDAEIEEVLEEYADCFICLLDSLSRAGFSVQELTDKIRMKTMKNKGRKWKKNPDNSYSHIKEEWPKPNTSQDNIIFRS